jgi:LemA protein
MIGLYIILGIVVALAVWAMLAYNRFIALINRTKEAWADIDVQLKRRFDLIPNLVQTVAGSANFEKSTLTDVIQARASASSIKIDPKDLTPEKLKEFQQSQGQLSQALGRLMVVSEQYPQLKSNENFKSLQDQLEGTENRIKVSRDGFNDAVAAYNTKVTSFPANIMAGMLGFKEKTMFEADQGAQKAPGVKF